MTALPGASDMSVPPAADQDRQVSDYSFNRLNATGQFESASDNEYSYFFGLTNAVKQIRQIESFDADHQAVFKYSFETWEYADCEADGWLLEDGSTIMTPSMCSECRESGHAVQGLLSLVLIVLFLRWFLFVCSFYVPDKLVKYKRLIIWAAGMCDPVSDWGDHLKPDSPVANYLTTQCQTSTARIWRIIHVSLPIFVCVCTTTALVGAWAPCQDALYRQHGKRRITFGTGQLLTANVIQFNFMVALIFMCVAKVGYRQAVDRKAVLARGGGPMVHRSPTPIVASATLVDEGPDAAPVVAVESVVRLENEGEDEEVGMRGVSQDVADYYRNGNSGSSKVIPITTATEYYGSR
jgi:hypothetical protein